MEHPNHIKELLWQNIKSMFLVKIEKDLNVKQKLNLVKLKMSTPWTFGK